MRFVKKNFKMDGVRLISCAPFYSEGWKDFDLLSQTCNAMPGLEFQHLLSPGNLG